MTPDQRLGASEAFWREDQNDIEVQHAEAVVMLSRRMKFRPKSMAALPIERRAKLLAQVPDVSDAVATRALISYHFTVRRDLMAAFLDALEIKHENGLIQDESVPPPARDKLVTAIGKLRAAFPAHDVDLYLKTLTTLDGDTWAELDGALTAEAAAS
jgi:hypothetical protein